MMASRSADSNVTTRRRRAALEFADGDLQRAASGEDHGALDEVLQFADVARPVIARPARSSTRWESLVMRRFMRRAYCCTK